MILIKNHREVLKEYQYDNFQETGSIKMKRNCFSLDENFCLIIHGY